MWKSLRPARGKVWSLVRVGIINNALWPLLSHFQVKVTRLLGLGVLNFVMWPLLRQARVKVFTWSQWFCEVAMSEAISWSRFALVVRVRTSK